MAEAKKEDKKKEVAYFRCDEFAGLTVTAGVKDGVRQKERFTAYYDTFKGDTVKVGYLKTDNPVAIAACRKLDYVEELEEKEYTQAIEGDGKRHKPLKKAPVAAV